MSQALLDLIGNPSNLTFGLQFDQWVDQFLPTAGIPNVPDPLTQPGQCATYLNGVRETTKAFSTQRPLIRVADKDLKIMCELWGELNASCEDLLTEAGKATINIRYDNWLVDWMINQTMPIEDLNLLIDPNPTKPDWRTRWGGKIVELHIKKDDKGIHSVELVAVHFRKHAEMLLVGANPIFPPEVQLPKMWVLPGPVRTICAITAFINLGRIFMPGWSTIDNIFNPAAWISPLGPDAVLNVLPTEWPIQVAFVDTVFDQSRWSTVAGTWNSWEENFKDVLNDGGCAMRCYTYLTTDPDSPNVELTNLLNIAPELLSGILGIDLSQLTQTIEQLSAPLRNCVIFSFEQIDGITGPTGTVADGLLSTVAVTLDDLITPVTVNLATGQTFDPGQVLNGEPIADASGVDQTYLIQQLLDVAPAPPRVIWWDGTYNGFLNTDLTWHKGTVKKVMTGGHSPRIVNEAQTFAIRYGLSQLSDVINWYLGMWSGGEQQNTNAVGIENLYQGQLDDTLLAYEAFTDPIRALNAGDVAWQEYFEKSAGGTAYTLASILALRSGDYKTRDFASFQAETMNGQPWMADVDYFLGDRVGFEDNGVIYVDNVYGIKREWDWKKALTLTNKVGEDKKRGDPFAAAFASIKHWYAFVGQLAGQGTIFTGG